MICIITFFNGSSGFKDTSRTVTLRVFFIGSGSDKNMNGSKVLEICVHIILKPYSNFHPYKYLMTVWTVKSRLELTLKQPYNNWLITQHVFQPCFLCYFLKKKYMYTAQKNHGLGWFLQQYTLLEALLTPSVRKPHLVTASLCLYCHVHIWLLPHQIQVFMEPIQ